MLPSITIILINRPLFAVVCNILYSCMTLCGNYNTFVILQVQYSYVPYPHHTLLIFKCRKIYSYCACLEYKKLQTLSAVFYMSTKKFMGLIGMPFWRTSKCRCGPVVKYPAPRVLGVPPVAPITCPLDT